MFRKSKKIVDTGNQLVGQTKKAHKFLSDPQNLKLLQQYLKILIAYLQVIGSFIIFKVKWPGSLQSCISWVQTVSGMIKIDLLEFPGLACPCGSPKLVQMISNLVLSLFLCRIMNSG